MLIRILRPLSCRQVLRIAEIHCQKPHLLSRDLFLGTTFTDHGVLGADLIMSLTNKKKKIQQYSHILRNVI